MFIGIALVGAGVLASVGAAPLARLRQSWTIVQPAGLADADRAGVGLGRPITSATYVLRHPVVVGRKGNIALVATSTLDFRSPFRLPSDPGWLATSEKTAGVEWLRGDGWAMSAGYASTRPIRMLGKLDQMFGSELNAFRTAKGLRIAAEFLPADDAAPRQSLALDVRLQRVRMQDTALIGAGEKLGEARLALVFKRSW